VDGDYPSRFWAGSPFGKGAGRIEAGRRMGFAGGLFGGYFQWVLDAACEAVEWPYQPLRPVALRMALDQGSGVLDDMVG